MAQHNLFGTQAEEKALEYLLQRGYQLLEKITATLMRR